MSLKGESCSVRKILIFHRYYGNYRSFVNLAPRVPFGKHKDKGSQFNQTFQCFILTCTNCYHNYNLASFSTHCIFVFPHPCMLTSNSDLAVIIREVK